MGFFFFMIDFTVSVDIPFTVLNFFSWAVTILYGFSI
jgi:hypothetical protein